MTPSVPRHVAIIMDGNGRWAKARGLNRVKGHEVGVERVEEAIRTASDLGIRYLTFYSFSKENWKRPSDEVSFLMDLLSSSIDKKLKAVMGENVRFEVIGDLSDLPEKLRKKIADGKESTKHHTGMTAIFAMSYSSRWEITDAARRMAREAAEGKLRPEDVTEELFSRYLTTAGIPDPDLLIRTSGEQRISNFLLWQLSYAELYFTEKYWPDFTAEEFHKALEEYRKRERRFGRTGAQTSGKNS